MAVQQDIPSETETNLEIKSILLLDDDADLADTLKKLLESHNFLVTTVGNGVEGVREIMRFDFDLIMCDMMMPHMPGDMFYFAVERTKPHLCPRFIFVTGFPDKPEVVHFLSGLEDAVVLHKPVSNEELVRTIFVCVEEEREAVGGPVRRQGHLNLNMNLNLNLWKPGTPHGRSK